MYETYRQVVFYRRLRENCIASLAREKTGNVLFQPISLQRFGDCAAMRSTRERELCRNTELFSSHLPFFFFSLALPRSFSIVNFMYDDDDDDERTQVATDHVYVARFQYARSLFQATPAKPETTFNRKPDRWTFAGCGVSFQSIVPSTTIRISDIVQRGGRSV